MGNLQPKATLRGVVALLAVLFVVATVVAGLAVWLNATVSAAATTPSGVPVSVTVRGLGVTIANTGGEVVIEACGHKVAFVGTSVWVDGEQVARVTPSMRRLRLRIERGGVELRADGAVVVSTLP